MATIKQTLCDFITNKIESEHFELPESVAVWEMRESVRKIKRIMKEQPCESDKLNTYFGKKRGDRYDIVKIVFIGEDFKRTIEMIY